MGEKLFALVVLILGGYVAVFIVTHTVSIATYAPAEGAAVAESDATQNDFSQTGTLVFYPNNVGPVPYLFYKNGDGKTVAKALVFPSGAPSDFSEWSGARITIAGVVHAEHVLVRHIAYVSGP